MQFNTRYNPGVSPSFQSEGDSMTRQEFAAECDINQLVARAMVGDIQITPLKESFFDATTVPANYEEAMEIVLDAQQHFNSLPSQIRDRFANDPGKLLAFVGDANNRSEAISLGLIAAPAAQVESVEKND